MQYRKFGKTGWDVSAVGMGCWGLSGQWGQVDERLGVETVHAALDAGINLFDTADAYGPRRSEELLGKGLHGRRHEAIIATKVGNLARQDGPLSFETPEHVYLCCDASLHRLGTDYIDFYQCHIREHPRHDVFLEAFERLLEAGKIRSYGTSTYIVSEIETFNQHERCAGVQLPYSVIERTYEDDALSFCAAHEIGTLIRGPLAQGVLSGKFSPTTTFEDSVRASWNEGAARERFLQRLEAVERIRPLVSESRSMAQIALAFVLAHPAVTCAIPGAKSPEQVQANAAAAEVALSADELSQLRAIGSVDPV